MTNHKIYVLLSAAGELKVGCSRDPATRAKRLAREREIACRLIYIAGVERDAFRVEHNIHRLLQHHQVEGEWFDCTPTQAIVAINAILNRAALHSLPVYAGS